MSTHSSELLQAGTSELIWIHCNRCYDMYATKARRFFLLACRHIACESCAPPQPSQTPNDRPIFKCPLATCAKAVRGHQLSNVMTPYLKELFHPQPWLNDLPQGRVMQFQEKQREHFFQGTVRMQRKAQKLQQITEQVRLRAKQKFEEIEQVHRERNAIEQRIREINVLRKQQEARRSQRKKLSRSYQPSVPSVALSASTGESVFKQRQTCPHFSSASSGAGSGAGAGRGRTVGGPHVMSFGDIPRNPHAPGSATGSLVPDNSFVL